MTDGVWPGEWVASRLGVRLRDEGLLTDLVGLAVRRNPRRAHLLVSSVLGKHVPTDPRLVYGAGLALGHLVRGCLGAASEDVGPPLRAALRGGSCPALRDRLREPVPPVDAIVLGYAETATALGHAVADALGGAYYLHSTRRPVEGFAAYGGFEEEHSHATSHLLLPGDSADLDRDVPFVLVDDELSTGQTVLNTISALHAVRPRRHYVLAALVDMRSPADLRRVDALAERLGARIDAVSLAQGSVELPPGILETGQALVAELAARDSGSASGVEHEVRRLVLDWPPGLPDGGRHGFSPSDRALLEKELPRMTDTVLTAFSGHVSRMHVLGFEELMYVPLRLAEGLADALPGADVRYSTTTRSPVLAVDDPGYAIRTRIAFPSHDDPPDGPGERYAYNVTSAFDQIVLVVDDAGDTAALTDGLLACLRSFAPVLVVTVPSPRRLA